MLVGRPASTGADRSESTSLRDFIFKNLRQKDVAICLGMRRWRRICERLSDWLIQIQLLILPVMIRLADLLMLGLITLSQQRHAQRESGMITVRSGTLIIVGVSKTDITIATDSKSEDLQHAVKTGEAKLVQVGTFAACTLSGNSRIDLNEPISNKPIESVDFGEILIQWARDHRSVSVAPGKAHASVSELMKREMKRFYSSHRDVDIPPLRVTLACFGYHSAGVKAFVADLRESLTNENLEPSMVGGVEHELTPGFFFPFGVTSVCDDVLQGSSPLLQKYRQVGAVKKYRSLMSSGELALYTTADFIELSRTCLVATESKNGLGFDPHADLVGAPNEYAVISRKSGFRFLQSH
jgi:hypothetical protein